MRSWWSSRSTRWWILGRPDGGDLLLAARIALFAAVVPALLRLAPARWPSLLEPRRAPGAPAPNRVAAIVRLVDGLLGSGWPLAGRSCLTRGMTLYYFLRRAGLDVTLAFGVGWVDGAFAGHCWLVKAGEPFLEPIDPRPLFATVYHISPASVGDPPAGLPRAVSWR